MHVNQITESISEVYRVRRTADGTYEQYIERTPRYWINGAVVFDTREEAEEGVRLRAIPAHVATITFDDDAEEEAWLAAHGAVPHTLSRAAYEARCVAAHVDSMPDAWIVKVRGVPDFSERAAHYAQSIVRHRLIVARYRALLADDAQPPAPVPVVVPAEAEMAAQISTALASARDETERRWGPNGDMTWAEYLASDGERR